MVAAAKIVYVNRAVLHLEVVTRGVVRWTVRRGGGRPPQQGIVPRDHLVRSRRSPTGDPRQGVPHSAIRHRGATRRNSAAEVEYEVQQEPVGLVRMMDNGSSRGGTGRTRSMICHSH